MKQKNIDQVINHPPSKQHEKIQQKQHKRITFLMRIQT